jgi:PRTRC genetic system ThiF family protein
MQNKHKTFEAISEAHAPISVCVIGCGGTGYEVFRELVRMNDVLIRLGKAGMNVTVYDPKKISLANMGRQLFTESEIGMHKASVLVDRANRQFGLEWNAIDAHWDGDINHNIIISCVDKVMPREQIYHFLNNDQSENIENYPYYWMDYGNGKNFGQVVLGTNPALEWRRREMEDEFDFATMPHVLDHYPDMEDEPSEPSCTTEQALSSQDLNINGILAKLGTDMLYKLIRWGETEINGIVLNLKNYQMMPIKL